jgi:hypothetical protein
MLRLWKMLLLGPGSSRRRYPRRRSGRDDSWEHPSHLSAKLRELGGEVYVDADTAAKQTEQS